MEKTVNGFKIIRRWTPALIISLFLLLLGVGALVAGLYFLPFMKIYYADPYDGPVQELVINMKDFVFAVLGQFIPGMSDMVSADFMYFYQTILPSIITSNASIWVLVILYAVFAILAVIVIFAVAAIITFLIGICSGRLKAWRAPKNIMWTIFALFLVLSAVFIVFSFVGPMLWGYGIAKLDIDGNTDGTNIAILGGFLIYIYIYLGVLFLLALILTFIYLGSFKDRIFVADAKRIVSAQEARKNQLRNEIYDGMAANPGSGNAANQIYINSGYPVVSTSEGQTVIAGGNNSGNPTPVREVKYNPSKGLPPTLSSIGGHAFSQNPNLEVAIIPDGIKEIGASAFSNCPNLAVVAIPTSIRKIGYNAFFGCKKLARINYAGKKSEWKHITRGSNWLSSAGTTTVICTDGAITVNPYH